MEFNREQQQAMEHKDGPMLVLAGPGSGKTEVIIRRTRKLIQNYQVARLCQLHVADIAGADCCSEFGGHLYQGGCRTDEGAIFTPVRSEKKSGDFWYIPWNLLRYSPAGVRHHIGKYRR